MNRILLTWLGLGLATLARPATAGNPDLSKLAPAAKQTGVTYAKDIRPIFEASCFRCHGEERPKGGLRLDSLAAVLQGSREGKVISPSQSEKSKLVIAVARLDPEIAMPPEPRPGGGRGGKRGGGGDGKAPGAKEGGKKGGTPQPRPKPLTAEQVGLIRAWVDQGAN